VSGEAYIFPLAGTPAHAEFVRRAKDPNSFEGKLAAQMVSQAVEARSQHLREMLQQMVELVPGQLFRDIEAFHRKFGLEPTDDPGHRLPDDVLEFRIKFMLEELREYANSVGMDFDVVDGKVSIEKVSDEFVAEQALDGLLDLCYVAVGSAYLHRFSEFNEAWRRVQEANMSKVRADSADDDRSHRKHMLDIVKPVGFKPPVLTDLLDEVCPQCRGAGTCSDLRSEPDDCGKCGGSGRVRRKVEDGSGKVGRS